MSDEQKKKDAIDGQYFRVRTKQVALETIRLYASLPKRTETLVLGKQLLQSGT